MQAAEPSVNRGTHDPPCPRFYISGLKNASGQSCFFNAALQMLASSSRIMSPDVKQALLQIDGSPRKLINLLQNINSISTEKISYSSQDLLATLAKTHAHLDGQSQQDSHEALIALLDAVHCDVAVGSSTGMHSMHCKRSDTYMRSPYLWNWSTEIMAPTGDQNITDALFEGFMRSKITCMTCSSSADSTQKSWVLSLPVSSQAQLHAENHAPKGWNISQQDNTVGKAANMRDGGKSSKKLTSKAQKARDKGIKKEEKRRRKQEQHDKLSSTSEIHIEISGLLCTQGTGILCDLNACEMNQLMCR